MRRLAPPQKPNAAPSKPTSAAANPPREDAIRVISWDLSALPAMAGGRAADAGNTPWRTSFGSERVNPAGDTLRPQGRCGLATRHFRCDPAAPLLFPGPELASHRDAAEAHRRRHARGSRERFIRHHRCCDPRPRRPSIARARVFSSHRRGAERRWRQAMLARNRRSCTRSRSIGLACLLAVPPACAEGPACRARTRLTERQESKRQSGKRS